MFYLEAEKADASFLLNSSAVSEFNHQRADCQTYMRAQSTYDYTSDSLCVGGYSCENKIKESTKNERKEGGKEHTGLHRRVTTSNVRVPVSVALLRTHAVYGTVPDGPHGHPNTGLVFPACRGQGFVELGSL